MTRSHRRSLRKLSADLLDHGRYPSGMTLHSTVDGVYMVRVVQILRSWHRLSGQRMYKGFSGKSAYGFRVDTIRKTDSLSAGKT